MWYNPQTLKEKFGHPLTIYKQVDGTNLDIETLIIRYKLLKSVALDKIIWMLLYQIKHDQAVKRGEFDDDEKREAAFKTKAYRMVIAKGKRRIKTIRRTISWLKIKRRNRKRRLRF